MPQSLTDHLQSKYFNDEVTDDTENLVQIHLPKKEITALSAANEAINSVGSLTADLSKCLPNVKTLDLSNTSIKDIQLVKQILSLFPNLTDLILSNNRQLTCSNSEEECEEEATDASSESSQLCSVAASNCSYTWSDVVCFAEKLWPPSIQSLTLHGNRISSICIPERTCFLQNLTHLDISYNPLNDWEQICNLAQLPRYLYRSSVQVLLPVVITCTHCALLRNFYSAD